jgi:hypothetical protein
MILVSNKCAARRLVRFVSIVAGVIGACGFAVADDSSRLARESIVRAVEAQFRTQYVAPEIVPAIVDRLEKSLTSGRFDGIGDVVFADRVTEDLRAVAHDMHLSLRDDSVRYAASISSDGQQNASDSLQRARAKRSHDGLTELRILPGNIRYLRIREFDWITDQTGAAYDDAVRFLKDADAIIIDLRGNGGGSHAAVRYLVSHFLPPETFELSFIEASKTPKQSWTLDYLPAGRLIGIPLYVLIDGDVASGAEAFAYDVRQFKLGELVGTKTVGAANNNRLLPIAPRFILSISYGHPVHAVSQSNWEGVGVKPDVASSSAQALDVAHLRALARLTDGTDDPQRRSEYVWARVDVEARLHPIVGEAKAYGRWAGTYGKYKVQLRERTLWMQWPGRDDFQLIPLTSDGLFAAEGSDLLRIRFKPQALDILWADDVEPRTVAKTSKGN